MRPVSPPSLPENDSSWAKPQPSSPSCVAAVGGHGSPSNLGASFSRPFSKNDQFHFLSNVDGIHQLEVLAAVGEGPMRFGPVCRSTSVQEDLMKCSVPAMESYIKLKLAIDNEGIDLQQRFTDEQIFRVAQYKDFHVGKSLRLLKRMDPRFMNTTARQLEDQLRTQTLFPLPCVRSDSIDSFFYMRPARYNPNITPTPTIIANLIYVMDTLYERHRDYSKHKIGFIANMNDWTMQHFAVDYCFQFMQALQGRTAPLNVDLVSGWFWKREQRLFFFINANTICLLPCPFFSQFLIVNPPSWFNKIWKIMKPMLSPAFRKKVHMIPEEKLGKFLQPGFSKHLPDEFKCGQADVPALVEDFITFRKHVEESSLDRADKAMNVALPTWAASKSTSDTKQQRRRGRRPSTGVIPLSKSHAERDALGNASNGSSSVELDYDDSNKKAPVATTTATTATTTQHSEKRSVLANSTPISSWSSLNGKVLPIIPRTSPIAPFPFQVGRAWRFLGSKVTVTMTTTNRLFPQPMKTTANSPFACWSKLFRRLRARDCMKQKTVGGK